MSDAKIQAAIDKYVRARRELIALSQKFPQRLVSCPSDSFTKSIDLFEDRVGRRSPHERVAATVIPIHEALDMSDEISDTAEGATSDGPLGDDVEPDLDLIEPRRVRRRVVDVKARSGCEPSSNLGVLVSRVVVDDEMDVQLLWDRRVDVAQELEELLVTMTLLALRQHATRGDVEGGE